MEELYSHPRMAGGFNWDWVDQGIYAPGTNHVLYGGDFGDKPNLKAFCLNGVVSVSYTHLVSPDKAYGQGFEERLLLGCKCA